MNKLFQLILAFLICSSPLNALTSQMPSHSESEVSNHPASLESSNKRDLSNVEESEKKLKEILGDSWESIKSYFAGKPSKEDLSALQIKLERLSNSSEEKLQETNRKLSGYLDAVIEEQGDNATESLKVAAQEARLRGMTDEELKKEKERKDDKAVKQIDTEMQSRQVRALKKKYPDGAKFLDDVLQGKTYKFRQEKDWKNFASDLTIDEKKVLQAVADPKNPFKRSDMKHAQFLLVNLDKHKNTQSDHRPDTLFPELTTIRQSMINLHSIKTELENKARLNAPKVQVYGADGNITTVNGHTNKLGQTSMNLPGSEKEPKNKVVVTYGNQLPEGVVATKASPISALGKQFETVTINNEPYVKTSSGFTHYKAFDFDKNKPLAEIESSQKLPQKNKWLENEFQEISLRAINAKDKFLEGYEVARPSEIAAKDFHKKTHEEATKRLDSLRRIADSEEKKQIDAFKIVLTEKHDQAYKNPLDFDGEACIGCNAGGEVGKIMSPPTTAQTSTPQASQPPSTQPILPQYNLNVIRNSYRDDVKAALNQSNPRSQANELFKIGYAATQHSDKINTFLSNASDEQLRNLISDYMNKGFGSKYRDCPSCDLVYGPNSPFKAN